MRYTFYREHKYITFTLTEFERLIAVTDFTDAEAVAHLNSEFQAVQKMLRWHAGYEDKKLHPLLKAKGSLIFEKLEKDHERYAKLQVNFQSMLNNMREPASAAQQIAAGDHFYMAYRTFLSDNFTHLCEEEMLLMPEFQRFYTDAELRLAELEAYEGMSTEEMVQLLKAIFPCMNPHDRETFLRDIKEAQPDKFAPVWDEVKTEIEAHEQEALVKKLEIS